MLAYAMAALCVSGVWTQSLAVLPGLASAVQGGLDVGKDATLLGGTLTGQASGGLTGAAKQLVAVLAGLRAAALKGGVNAFKGAVDLGSRLTANIPIVGPVVGLRNTALKTGADLVNSLGQNAINASQKLINVKLDVIDGVLQAGSEALRSAANASATAASQGVQSAMDAVNAAVDRGGAAIATAGNAMSPQTTRTPLVTTSRSPLTTNRTPASIPADDDHGIPPPRPPKLNVKPPPKFPYNPDFDLFY